MSPTHRFLLDTNIISDLIKNPQGKIAQHLEAIYPTTACTSIIVASEIRYGLKKKDSKRLTQQAELILAAMDILPLCPPADYEYGVLRVYLANKGEMIGQNDLFIAAHAKACQLTLVTANTSEFRRVPDLLLENWLE